MQTKISREGTMYITIVGGGNVGTQLAAHCAEKGHKVTVFTSRPDQIGRVLTVINENDEVIHQGEIYAATNDESAAFSAAELICVTMPAFLMKRNADRIKPYVRPGMKIWLVPGTGGGECAFQGCVSRGATLFGVQRVPSVARLTEPGKTVRAVGYRSEMFVAAIPASAAEECCGIVENLTGIKTSALPNYLNITLTPSNPILHTTRLKDLFGDYHEGMVYERVPLFYEDWTDEASRLLLVCDQEVQTLCRRLEPFDLSNVKSLRVHYESPTAEAMTDKIRHIKGFQGISSPMLRVKDGYIPDFNSRYFTADFAFGLVIIVQIAEFADLKMPNIESLLIWYETLACVQERFRFSDYGIMEYDDFVEFYKQ